MSPERRQQLDALYAAMWGGSCRSSDAVGATEPQVAELLRHVGGALPAAYLDILRTYGEMADTVWAASEVVRANYGLSPESAEAHQTLYGSELLIAGEGEAWDITLDTSSGDPERMPVTEWDMTDNSVARRWDTFDGFLDALLEEQGVERRSAH